MFIQFSDKLVNSDYIVKIESKEIDGVPNKLYQVAMTLAIKNSDGVTVNLVESYKTQPERDERRNDLYRLLDHKSN